MRSARSAGRIVGMLLPVHLAAGLIVPYVLLRPLTTPPAGFLEIAAGMSLQIRLNVLALFAGGAVTLGIAIAAWPVVRERAQGLGLWLLGLAAVNLSLQAVENGHWLSMLTVSQAYAAAGAEEAGHLQSLAMGVRTAWKWAHYSHILAVGGWMIVFHCLLYRAALIPRALAAAGLVASVLQITGITLPVFLGYRMPFPTLFGMPLALTYLVLAVWLMASGFKEPHDTPRAESRGAEVPAA